MKLEWIRLRREVLGHLEKWQGHLEVRHWDLVIKFRVRDPEQKGYCEVDIADIAHLRGEITFYLKALSDEGDREHREYLVLHELLHLLTPNSTETQVARLARTILLFERRAP